MRHVWVIASLAVWLVCGNNLHNLQNVFETEVLRERVTGGKMPRPTAVQ
jgi:hypothetical protein